MKLSDVKANVDSLIAEHGDFDIGDARRIEFMSGAIGWAGGWGNRVVSTGVRFVNKDGEKFVGVQKWRSRIGRGFYEPTEDELGPEGIIECKP